MQDSWDISGRDVVPSLSSSAKPSGVGAALLYAMLRSEGSAWSPPYDAVRRNLQIRSKPVAPELEEQAASRFRTYKTLFQGLGLLYISGGQLRLTDAGRALLQVLEENLARTDQFAAVFESRSRRQVAEIMAPVLARYRLANPATRHDYPDDTDIRPLRAIWAVMRELDGRLHWEELGRALTPCLREQDLPQVIEKIRVARGSKDYDPSNPAMMDDVLGPRLPDAGSSQSDRLDTWFSRAAFKDLFLEGRDRADGFRYLQLENSDLIDSALELPDEWTGDETAEDYSQDLGRMGQSAERPAGSRSAALDEMILDRVRRFGGRQIIALVGAAGTGKTSAAHRVAAILSEGDQSRSETVQFHAAFTYDEFVGGLTPRNGTFEPAPGVLVRMCDKAAERPAETFVLVIDELSRADVSNVLGELLTYIEYRGREFFSPALNRSVAIPANLRIIATLNPQDRSVLNMDDALVRRLRHVPVPRSVDALRDVLSNAGMPVALQEQVVNWYAALPDDVPFGHGVFVGISSERDLHDLWHESIHFFLHRGGIAVHPSAREIAANYLWTSPPSLGIDLVENESVYAENGSVDNVSDSDIRELDPA